MQSMDNKHGWSLFDALVEKHHLLYGRNEQQQMERLCHFLETRQSSMSTTGDNDHECQFLTHCVEQVLGQARKMESETNNALDNKRNYSKSKLQKLCKRIQEYAEKHQSLFHGKHEKVLKSFIEKTNQQAQKEETEERAKEELEREQRRKRRKEKRAREMEDNRKREEQLNHEREERQREALQREILEKQTRRRRQETFQLAGTHAKDLSLRTMNISEHATLRWNDRGVPGTIKSFVERLDDGYMKFLLNRQDDGSWELQTQEGVTLVLDSKKTVIITVLRDDDYDYKMDDKQYAPAGKCWMSDPINGERPIRHRSKNKNKKGGKK